MTVPSDERILAFLDGDLDDAQRREVLDAMERDPSLTARVRTAAVGRAEVEAWVAGRPSIDEGSVAGPPTPSVRPGVPAWWVPLAVAASIALTVPATIIVRSGSEAATVPAAVVSGLAPTPVRVAGAPVAPDPSYVVVLHGRWPDAGAVDPAETQRRAREYWTWTADLAERGLLLAAGDLRWEPGVRVSATGSPVDSPPGAVDDPDFLVGMFAVRASSYDAALAIAEECPHLTYGGSVSVRRVGAGFVTTPGMADWSDRDLRSEGEGD